MADVEVTFLPGEDMEMVQIIITNDEIPEGSETFAALLSGTDQMTASVIAPSTATITIEDNDGM